MWLNLEHSKVLNKPHFKKCGKTQGLLNLQRHNIIFKQGSFLTNYGI